MGSIMIGNRVMDDKLKKKDPKQNLYLDFEENKNNVRRIFMDKK